MDYRYFNIANISNPQKERYVRLHTCWAFNDSRRKSELLPFSSMEFENLRAFITFLDENDETDRIMKAEAHSKLGEFEIAEKLLAMPFGDDIWIIKPSITNLDP